MLSGFKTERTAAFVLTSSESKRLIAKAVAVLPQVQRALATGRIVVANGTTNAFVAEELLGERVQKERFAAGVICDGVFCVTLRETRTRPFALVRGEITRAPWQELIKEFDSSDVFIKGANALDPDGNVGVLMSDLQAGTVGSFLGIATARGAHIVVPVGLEKLIPSVRQASLVCGICKFDWTLGSSVGMMPIIHATVISEIEALELLAGVKATQISAGGIGGSEGAVGLGVRGDETGVLKALEVVKAIKGEPPVPAARRECTADCPERCNWIERKPASGS
ncbi:MAG: hypothetical protein HYY08_01640 [Firmicutes bacterium]|nr:hypothetical protein [Bacillota bacterium]